jgi:hypothetical protein
MTANRLKFNSGKIEALVIGTRQKVTSITFTHLQLADATVPFSQTIKSLSVYLDSTLSMQPQIFIIKTCFFHLHRIAAIPRYLTREASLKLVISFISSRFDYCNWFLAGIPASSLQGLQRVLNCAARLILRKKKADNIETSPLYCDLCTGFLLINGSLTSWLLCVISV